MKNQVSPIFLVALLYGSYPMSVMFSYCLIGGCHGSAFLYLLCYCFSPWGGGRHFGGDLVGRIRDPPLPHPRATPRSGGVSPTGPGPPPWGTPEWWVFQQPLQQVMGFLALGQHIAGLPVQVLLHQPGRALHRLEQPVQPRRLDNLSQLPCHLLLRALFPVRLGPAPTQTAPSSAGEGTPPAPWIWPRWDTPRRKRRSQYTSSHR